MTGALEYPSVDDRRLTRLREALLRDIAAMAPDWRAAHDLQGADRALVEIAARLGEEATRRLDMTSQRDALAFLQMFDIAPPDPVAAEGFVVFALKSDKTRPVSAPACTGVEIADLNGVKVPFETTEDISIQPARIARLATVDPAADRIEIAPDAVSLLEPQVGPTIRYSLKSAVGPDDLAMTLDPPIGIEPGDLLRIGLIDAPPVYVNVVSFGADGFTQIAGPVGRSGLTPEAVDPDAQIQRMRRLDAFSMPDLQQHGLYLGDADLLNVKEPATITLHFQPDGIAALLRTEGVRFEVWGTRSETPEDQKQGWHPLVPLAQAKPETIMLLKAWTGAIDETELGARKSRWLRIVPARPILPQAGGTHPLMEPNASVNQIRLGIETETTSEDSTDTISQIALNGQPLSHTDAFQPFGAVPQRNDTFALAAPEAFTKPGAEATLEFELVDGTLATVSASLRFDGKRNLYGIGRNGRLQVLEVKPEKTRWREIRGPIAETGVIDDIRLDPSFGVQAYQCIWEGVGEVNDIVLVRGQNGVLYSAMVVHRPALSAMDPKSFETVKWSALPDLDDEATAAGETASIVVVPRFSIKGTYGFVYATSSIGCWFIELFPSGEPGEPAWLPIAVSETRPTLPVSPSVVPVSDPTQVGAGDVAHLPLATCLAADAESRLWVFTADKTQLSWRKITDAAGEVARPIEVANGSLATGTYYSEGGQLFLAISAPFGDGLRIWKTTVSDNAVDVQTWRHIKVENASADSRLTILPQLRAADADLPHVVAYCRTKDKASLVEWAPDGRIAVDGQDAQDDLPLGLLSIHDISRAVLQDVKDPGDPGVPNQLMAVFPPEGDDAGEDLRFLVALGGADQTLITTAINRSHRGLYDWLAMPDAPGSRAFVLRTVDQQEALIAVTPVGRIEDDDGDIAVIQLGQGDTDWTSDVIGYWTDAAQTVATITDSGATDGFVLRGDPGSAPMGLPDADDPRDIDDIADPSTDSIQLLIELSSDPDQRIVLRPTARRDADDGTFTDILFGSDDARSRLEALGDGQGVRWFLAHEAINLPGGNPAADRYRLSLIHLDAVVHPVEAVSRFEKARAALEVTSVADDISILEQGWPDINQLGPAAGEIVKLIFEEESGEGLVSEKLGAGFSNPKLSWEYFNGAGWKKLVTGFADRTDDFAQSGKITFTVPHNLAQSEIGGQTDFWIRARLIGGDYGRPRYIVQSSDPEDDVHVQEVTVSTDHMRAPEIARISSRFSLEPVALPQLIVARNNLTDIDQSAANRLDGSRYAMFAGAFALNGGDVAQTGETDPCVAPPDPEQRADGDGNARALWIGLSQPLDPGLASFYVLAAGHRPDVFELQIDTLGPDGQWSRAALTGEDPTCGLYRNGLLRFSVSAPMGNINLLGAPLHWLRIRPAGGNAANWNPSLLGMWLNGVPVIQAHTILQEPLGSSDGEPGLEKKLLKTPVLPDTLELRIRERLGSEEVDELRRQFGAGAVLDEVPNLPGQWVRWRRVASLTDQPADARVLLVDAEGKVTFGDGQEGKLLLAGRDNIRAFSYRSGGQPVETAAFATAGVRSSIDGLETVLAPSVIAGGRDLPDPAELVMRMPAVLRHAGDALALVDIEALARDIDSEITQVRAFAPRRAGQPVEVAVLARASSREPVYSPARCDALARGLLQRMSAAWPGDCLRVVPVDFVPVRVKVTLVAKPGHLAALEAQAKQRLNTFLHAALGGPEGQGWPPGRELWTSDIRRALGDLPAYDRADLVTIRRLHRQHQGTLSERQVITTTETRHIEISVLGEAEA